MKKIFFLLVAILSAGFLITSCDNSKTYAEMLEEERDAIEKYVKEHNIKTISLEQFEKDTVTNVANNEYVGFSNGIYMQVVNRGDGEKFKSGNILLVRFLEYDIMGGDTTVVSNVDNPYSSYLSAYPDAFRYEFNAHSAYGKFVTSGGMIAFNMVNTYGETVPSGWLLPLQYLKDGAHIKLIVPSKMGHSTAQQYVYPYFYDIRKLQVD